MWEGFSQNSNASSLAMAIVVVLVLFSYHFIRGTPLVSRCFGLILSILLAVYVIDGFGDHGAEIFSRVLPIGLCQRLGYASLKECPTPLSSLVAVNIPIF